MRHARRSLQRIARLAAVGGLLCGGLMTTNAVASGLSARGEDPGGTVRSADLGTTLVSRLGASRTAGTWIGKDGRPVVAVTDSDAAAEVGRAGARAKVVRHSMHQLRSATDALRAAPRVPGTSWAVDYASNTVVVHADSTVSAVEWSRISDLAEQIGGFVDMQRTTGSFTTKVNGADAIFGRNGRCSAGFNVTDGRSNFILTAGHCGPPGTTWFQDPQGTERVGTTTAGSFPGGDFSLVQYQNGDASDARGLVGIGGGQAVRITAAADPVVGQEVFRSGSTTGVRSGRVTALNATVNYPEGTVTGLIEATVCAEPGDSGGPLFADGLALGVTSGGNGDCATGGITYYQPATTALAALGVSVTGGPRAAAADEGGDPGAAPPPADAGGLVPGTTEVPTTPAGIVNIRTLTPGLVVIGVSLLGLTVTRSIRSAQDRRSFRSHYSQSWN
ncbi:S1 family peptidase [Streptomyces sp. NPDC051219]|uniref:S1 family peptidase n=1 Tax=Streptomyces sp. NPDC051219 TaxID=3155283 RepID=UPI00341B2028